MAHKYYQQSPDAYVVFKWGNRELEGEFFRDSSAEIDFCFGDTSKKNRGYLRPFDKELRQWITDIHMNNHGIDFEKFLTVGELIECDSFVNHTDLKRPYLNVVVEEFRFIDKQELSSPQYSIADCRADLLKRQYLLSKALGEPDEVVSSLEKEFKAWVTPTFQPTRYTMTKFQKAIRNQFLRFIFFIMLIALFMVLK